MAASPDPVVRVEKVIVVKAQVSPRESRIMYLSSIDQRFGAYQRNLLIFEDDQGRDVVAELQKAIEELLVPYDFFAGRLQMNNQTNMVEICCNNAGAVIASATLNASVADIKDGPLDSQQYLYFPMDAKSMEELPMLTVQVTSFNCKGFAIGVLCHHAITDATSGINFLYNLSSVASGKGLLEAPCSDRSVFKPREPPQPKFPHDEFIEHPNLSTSRYSISLDTAINFEPPPNKKKVQKRRKAFHFSFQALSKLKARALEDGTLRECTTFEALAAYVWRAHSETFCKKQPDETLRLRFVLDVRNKMQPPLPRSFCGNAIYWAHAEVKVQDILCKPLSHIILQIQEARKKITDEYLRSGWDFLALHPDYWYSNNCDLGINAWPRAMLSAKELDFGWGKPCRVEFPLDPESSTVVFVPVESGVDVSMCLGPQQNVEFDGFAALQ